MLDSQGKALVPNTVYRLYVMVGYNFSIFDQMIILNYMVG